MPAEVIQRRFTKPLAERLRRSPDAGILLHWLGQAGFVVTAGGRRLLIDPYLSDTLAEKYRGTATPHERLMAAPVSVGDLGPVDLVLVTHHHTDHMDPGTLAPLGVAQPQTRFVVPAAAEAEALRRTGVGPERLILVDAGQTVRPWLGLAITAIRAAHEDLEQDGDGRYRFLGYALTFTAGDQHLTIVHSGDTVPYAGQGEDIAAFRPDLMLLPVNGRSPELKARGVPGNLTLEEAVALSVAVGAGTMVAHHHGLFAFNTCAMGDIEAKAAEPAPLVRLIPARVGLELQVWVS